MPEERKRIPHAYHERSSLRGFSRTFRVSRNTVTVWIKEMILPELSETLIDREHWAHWLEP
jgi:hypothetical protein